MYRTLKTLVVAGVLRVPGSNVKYYKTHVVKCGESGWSIANEHGIGLREVQQANPHVDISQVQAGQEIQLPVEIDVNLSGALHLIIIEGLETAFPPCFIRASDSHTP